MNGRIIRIGVNRWWNKGQIMKTLKVEKKFGIEQWVTPLFIDLRVELCSTTTYWPWTKGKKVLDRCTVTENKRIRNQISMKNLSKGFNYMRR